MSYVTVIVPSAPVWVPSQCSLAPNVTSVMSKIYDFLKVGITSHA
jgi:hypothetical protein